MVFSFKHPRKMRIIHELDEWMRIFMTFDWTNSIGWTGYFFLVKYVHNNWETTTICHQIRINSHKHTKNELTFIDWNRNKWKRKIQTENGRKNESLHHPKPDVHLDKIQFSWNYSGLTGSLVIVNIHWIKLDKTHWKTSWHVQFLGQTYNAFN